MIRNMTEPQAPETLLHTKLMMPRLHPDLVARPALWARLDAGLEHTLTLVAAPTGFGKTTLVSQWLAERRLPAAWVTLDENDNDPVRFWTYAATALRTFDPAIGRAALASLMGPQPPATRSILAGLINDLERLSTPSVLALEDFHAIHNAEILAGVGYLLQNLPSALHIVLVTRSVPDGLPLGILRARGELVEIDAAGLRFSLEESGQFLHGALKADLPQQALAQLQEKTEGWAAGLRLAALALQKGAGAAGAGRLLEGFSGGHRYVADYLTREVFESQPAARQEFLLRTCFLDRLCGALCDALAAEGIVPAGGRGAVPASGGSEGLLDGLEREGLFVTRLGTRPSAARAGRAWYRYNPLFAESIQYLARQRLGEAEVRALLDKASAWYESQQMDEDAIEMALAAGDEARAIELVNRYVRLNNISELVTLGRWLERIPAPLIQQYPEACLAYAEVILFTSDRFAPATGRRIEPFLQAAEGIWAGQGNTGRLGAALALRGMVLLWQGDAPRAFEYVRRSLELLPEHDVYWRGVSLLNAAMGEIQAGRMEAAQDRIIEGRALMGASQNIYGVLAATQLLGEVYYWQGSHDEARQTFLQIAAEAVGDESMLDDQAAAALGLANVAYELNDLAAAEEHARRALGLARQRDNGNVETKAAGRLALVEAAYGRSIKAQEQLKTFIAALPLPPVGTSPNAAARRELQCIQAQAALMAGDSDSLVEWQAMVSGEKGGLLTIQREREALALARLLLAQNQADEARALAATWKQEAAQNGRVRSQVEAGCIEALAWQAAGDAAKAVEALARALALAEERGFCRLVVDLGAPMASLLKASIPLLARRPLAIYASGLLRAFPAEAAGSRSSPEAEACLLVEPLSPQEVRVLRLLAAGLSNADIARELVVSTNTVKTHVKNVYRKLDIAARSEARQMLKELKLG